MIPYRKYRPLPAVKDEITEAPLSCGPVYACREKACAHKPMHAHSKRPYVVWNSKEIINPCAS